MVKTRKTVILRELIETDLLGEPCEPVSRVAVAAVFKNPVLGRFERDLSPLFDIGAELGQKLAEQAIALLNRPPVSYGKAAIVGVSGDMEHGGAVIHPRLGAPMRAVAGGGEAVIPSNVKVGPVGASIDLPLGHKDNPWSFDHFDTMTLCVPDAPAPEEIVMFFAYADRGRPIPRCGSGPIKM
ncbi:amino acid synthesis family protein [Palleronia sp. KMU-117]|uniref:amino acid synthesis family protein n=1 Tax=Palleronia sp. KMU-117 TaxID=3434108 RepID=UPI003D75CE73